ncbi:MAG: glycosyltransferase family 2 protein [Bacteroidia bacterium]
MLLVFEIFFWSFLAATFYAYVGYGLVLYILLKIRQRNVPPANFSDDFYPPVTIVIAAYNEAELLAEKIANTLALDYPRELLKIIFVTDGSDDKSTDILAQYPEVISAHRPERKGKLAAVTRVLPAVTTPFTVFTDANTLLNAQALKLILRHFSNPATGAVAGEKRIRVKGEDAAAGAGEGFYWRYESRLKKWDAQLHSVVGAAGELFAIRTSLFEILPEDTLIEDFVLTMKIAQKGFRVAYEPAAFALEAPSESIKEELKRKVRISAGGLQAVWRLSSLLNIFRYGWLSFQYISHRVLRWTLAPLGLPIVFLTNIALAIDGGWFYQLSMGVQILFYLAALTGYFLENHKIRLKILFIPYYFCLMNYAVYAGFFRLVTGRQSVLWEKAQREMVLKKDIQ